MWERDRAKLYRLESESVMESVIIELKVNKGESISGVNVVLFIFKRNKEFSSAATISSNSIFQ